MSDLSGIKLLVGAVSCRDWKTGFAISMDRFVRGVYRKGINGQKLLRFDFVSQGGVSCLPNGREGLLQHAFDEGYTHLLTIDDDMTFEPQAVDLMFSRNVPVIAANCRRKMSDITDIRGTANDFDNSTIDSRGKTGIQEVPWVGVCAFGLINLDAIKHVEAPRFEIRWIPEKKSYLGEDLYFCKKLREHQVPVHIDHDASNLIGHIGEYTYRFTEKPDVTEGP